MISSDWHPITFCLYFSHTCGSFGTISSWKSNFILFYNFSFTFKYNFCHNFWVTFIADNIATLFRSVFLNLLGFKFRLKTNFDITVPVTIFFKVLVLVICVFNHVFSTTKCIEGVGLIIFLTKFNNWYFFNAEFSEFLSFKNSSSPSKKAFRRLRNADLDHRFPTWDTWKIFRGTPNNFHFLNCYLT